MSGKLATLMRLVSAANVLVVLNSILFYVPAYSYSGKYAEEALASGDGERIALLFEHIQVGHAAYGKLFLVCFALMLTSSVFLWLKTGNPKKGG